MTLNVQPFLRSHSSYGSDNEFGAIDPAMYEVGKTLRNIIN